MARLIKVRDPASNSRRIEDPSLLWLYFDESVHLETAARIFGVAYQKYLERKGINKKVVVYNSLDTYGIGYAVSVEGREWGDQLFEVAGREKRRIHALVQIAMRESLTKEDQPLVDLDPKEVLRPYIGKDLSDILED